MKGNSRIRFNPGTKEIEIEGSESFVKTYFNILQAIISGTLESKTKESKPIKAAPIKVGKKQPIAFKGLPTKVAKKAAKKEPGIKRVTHIGMIVDLIQGSVEGISTAELKEKTGLAESQIWNIINRASKEGKIKKLKRGLYGAVSIE